MYSIGYCKNGTNIKLNESDNSTCIYVSHITIDTIDLDSLINNSYNPFLKMYYWALKKSQFKENIPEKITILNNNINNRRIIEMVVASEYLIHEVGISINEAWYEEKRKRYQEEIEKLNSSKDKNDRRRVVLMQHFIDTFDGYIEKKKKFVKEG